MQKGAVYQLFLNKFLPEHIKLPKDTSEVESTVKYEFPDEKSFNEFRTVVKNFLPERSTIIDPAKNTISFDWHDFFINVLKLTCAPVLYPLRDVLHYHEVNFFNPHHYNFCLTQVKTERGDEVVKAFNAIGIKAQLRIPLDEDKKYSYITIPELKKMGGKFDDQGMNLLVTKAREASDNSAYAKLVAALDNKRKNIIKVLSTLVADFLKLNPSLKNESFDIKDEDRGLRIYFKLKEEQHRQLLTEFSQQVLIAKFDYNWDKNKGEAFRRYYDEYHLEIDVEDFSKLPSVQAMLQVDTNKEAKQDAAPIADTDEATAALIKRAQEGCNIFNAETMHPAALPVPAAVSTESLSEPDWVFIADPGHPASFQQFNASPS